MTANTDIMDAKAAAQYLGIAAQTLARWRGEGQGPAHLKLGACVRYTVRDLDAWIATRRRSSTSQPPVNANT